MRARSYSERLKDPRWQKKRLEILERDDWKCRDCGGKRNTLHVDHAFYDGRQPWEYPADSLATFCDGCHKKRGAMRNAILADTVGMTLEELSILVFLSSFMACVDYSGFSAEDVARDVLTEAEEWKKRAAAR